MGNKPKQKEVKVTIASPAEDIMHVSTAQAIASLCIYSPQIVDFLVHKGCDVVGARTNLVKRAIEKGSTHILFIDTDMYFPVDVLEKMLALDKPIVAGEYYKRKFPRELVSMPLEGTERSETEPYKAAWAGTGLMLIDLSIFEKLPVPWFNFGRNSEGSLTLGEDVWFCRTAQDAGYDVWIIPTLDVKHIGEYAF